MEEHFRKSLGADYSKLFKEKPEKEKEEEEKMEVDPVKAFKDDLDMSGYTGIAASFFTVSLNNLPLSFSLFLTYLFFFQWRITLRKPLVTRGQNCRPRRRRRRRRRRTHQATPHPTLPKSQSPNC